MAEKGDDVTVTKSPDTQLEQPLPTPETVTGTGLKRVVYDLLSVTNGWKPAAFPSTSTTIPGELDLVSTTPGQDKQLTQDQVDALLPDIADARENQLKSLADLINSFVGGLTSVKDYCTLKSDANDSTVNSNGSTFTDFGTWNPAGTVTDNSNSAIFTPAADGVTVLRAGRYLVSCSFRFDCDAADQSIEARFAIDGIGVTRGPRVTSHYSGSTTLDETSLSLPAFALTLAANEKVSVQLRTTTGAAVGTVVADGSVNFLSIVEL